MVLLEPTEPAAAGAFPSPVTTLASVSMRIRVRALRAVSRRTTATRRTDRPMEPQTRHTMTMEACVARASGTRAVSAARAVNDEVALGHRRRHRRGRLDRR